MRLLLVAPNWIGDTLLAQPLLARLRARHPGLRIDAIAPDWTAPVLRRMPEIDEVIEVPFRHGELALGPRIRLGRRMQRRRYSEAIVLPNSFKSALVPFLAEIPLRVGFLGESRYGLLNVRHRLDESAVPLMAERYAPARRGAGTPGRAPDPDRADRGGRGESPDHGQPARPGPLAADRRVLSRRRVRAGQTLAGAALRGARAGARGAPSIGLADRRPGDARSARRSRQLSAGEALNLCGRTDLGAAIDLLSVTEAVVSNDSGLMHVAAALGRPLVALYGSSSPAHTPPLAPRARIVKIEIECSPCFARECPLGHFRCMNELSPERVLAEIDAAVAGARERA